MKVGIVGCGLIGKRRAQVVYQSEADNLVIVADVDKERAGVLAAETGCQAATDWQEVVNRHDLDIIIVATPNKFLMPVVVAALKSGKHVLCEKPPGRNIIETQFMVDAAKDTGRILKIGFNHRHHPAVWKAHELCSQGSIGPLMFIRSVYGHGGRPGYDKEWRGDADLAGGGELLDQGVHIIDLCCWFMGEFTEVTGFNNTYFWDLGYFPNSPGGNLNQLANDPQSQSHKQQLEDNAFAMLRTHRGQVAQFHTSWTQWKNRFTFEIIGRDGYIRIEGLGGSYGVETLTVGHRRPESGPPLEEQQEFAGPDVSWQAEWQEFTSAIHAGRQPLANGTDGLQVMRLIAAIYESSHSGQVVKL